MAGYVYLIGTPIFSWYKIGKTVNPEVRVWDLGVLLPFRIEVIGIWKAENHTALEALLHEKYTKNRINGEWFRFDKKEVSNLFGSLPLQARIFPSENKPDSVFAKFSNIERDCPEGQNIRIKITKRQKVFLLESERETCKQISMNKFLTKSERSQAKKEIFRLAVERIRSSQRNEIQLKRALNQSTCPSSL